MTKTTTFATLLSMASILFSCDRDDGVKFPEGQDLKLEMTDKAQIKETNKFTAKLFLEATKDLKQSENALLSPFGVSTVMAMVYNGANGETKNAISKALGFDQIDDVHLNAYYHKLINGLPWIEPRTELNMANAIWHNKNTSLKSEFLKVNEQFYLAKADKLDFASPQAKDVINAWVKEKTKNKIEKITETTSENDLAYLLNAIYFKGVWEQKFEKKNTAKANFNTASGQTVQTDFMYSQHAYGLSTVGASGLQAIEIPYSNKKFSMILLQQTDAMSSGWTTENLETFIDDLESEQVKFHPMMINLYVPKFRFSYGRTLNDDLTNLGMGIAFQNNADFSNLSEWPAKISEVKHKSFIEVDEEGTEATAVTIVKMEFTSTQQTPEIRFDHPFIFLIKENTSNLVLFIGRVNNPLSDQTEG